MYAIFLLYCVTIRDFLSCYLPQMENRSRIRNLNLNVYETNNSPLLLFSFGYVRFCQHGGGNSATAAESPAPVAETQDSKTIEISGKVIDTNGQPIIGATVFETGTANGITTDLNGGFTLTVTEKATLEFSYVGYKPQTLPASQGMVVTLEEALDIDAVVSWVTACRKRPTFRAPSPRSRWTRCSATVRSQTSQPHSRVPSRA